MRVWICVVCRHKHETSRTKCAQCSAEMSFVRPTEIPDDPSSSVSASSSRAATAPISAPTLAAVLPGDGGPCTCSDKKPFQVSGVIWCNACGCVIGKAVSTSGSVQAAPAPTAAHVELASAPLNPVGVDASGPMAIVLPWDEEVRFSGRLLLGRAAHPGSGAQSLPPAARARMQREFAGVSRFHAMLTADAAGVTVEDLGALNGSFVGDTAVRSGSPLSAAPPFELRLGARCTIRVRWIDP